MHSRNAIVAAFTTIANANAGAIIVRERICEAVSAGTGVEGVGVFLVALLLLLEVTQLREGRVDLALVDDTIGVRSWWW